MERPLHTIGRVVWLIRQLIEEEDQTDFDETYPTFSAEHLVSYTVFLMVKIDAWLDVLVDIVCLPREALSVREDLEYTKDAFVSMVSQKNLERTELAQTILHKWDIAIEHLKSARNPAD